jgi:hypothetical protein
MAYDYYRNYKEDEEKEDIEVMNRIRESITELKNESEKKGDKMHTL